MVKSNNKILIKAFGWPMGTVAHDDFGDIEEVN
jgi:hypothetical protein